MTPLSINAQPLVEWPAEGVTRAPYRVMSDPEIYRLEQARIFGGPVWHYLCLEAELPGPASFSKGATMREGEYESTRIRSGVEGVGLADSSLLDRRQEFADGVTAAIQSIFPTCVHQQICNTLALRQVVPLGVGRTEPHWTVFGYQDDDPALRQMRLKQANLIGPAGFVSVQDGSVGEYVQRCIAGTGVDRSAVIEMGGREIVSSTASRATEATIRGFWTGYRSLMGF